MDPENFYLPREDSFFFLKVLQEELKDVKNKIICEMGVGSGYLYNNLSSKKNIFCAVDINKNILQAENLFFSNLFNNINQKFIDIVYFNPPYVESDGSGYDDIRGAYAGGRYGREVIDRFIEKVEINIFYLLIIEVNRVDEIIRNIKGKNYNCIILKRKHIIGETIYILKASKKNKF